GDPAWRVVAARGSELALQSFGQTSAFGPTSAVTGSWLTYPSVLVLEDPGGPAGEAEAAALADFEADRIAAGLPRFGLDYQSAEVFPGELGVWGAAAVNYEKGCYLGQEIIARIHWRGRVVRGSRRIQCSDAGPLGSELLFEGRAVGRLTSLATDQ